MSSIIKSLFGKTDTDDELSDPPHRVHGSDRGDAIRRGMLWIMAGTSGSPPHLMTRRHFRVAIQEHLGRKPIGHRFRRDDLLAIHEHLGCTGEPLDMTVSELRAGIAATAGTECDGVNGFTRATLRKVTVEVLRR